MVRLRDTFMPDPERQVFYERLYRQVFRKLYKTMTPAHRTLAALTKREGSL